MKPSFDLEKNLNMGTKRAAVVAEVDWLHVEGLLSWESAPELVLPFPERGVLDEGREGQEDKGE